MYLKALLLTSILSSQSLFADEFGSPAATPVEPVPSAAESNPIANKKCSLLDIMARLVGITQKQVKSNRVLSVERQISKGMLEMLADNPYFFDKLRFEQAEFEDLLNKANVSGATQDMRITAIELFRTVGTIKAIDGIIPDLQDVVSRLQPSERQLNSKEKAAAKLLIETVERISQTIDHTKLPVDSFKKSTLVKPANPPTAKMPATKTELILLVEQMGNYLALTKENSHAQLPMLMSLYMRYVRSLEKFTTLDTNMTIDKDGTKQNSDLERYNLERARDGALLVKENNNFYKLVRTEPDIFFGIKEPTVEEIYEIIDSTDIGREALRDHILAVQKAATVRTMYAMVFTNPKLLDLTNKYAPTWTPLFRVLNEIGTRELYNNIHLPTVNQIVPVGEYTPTPERIHEALIAAYAKHGFSFLVTFFRAKRTTTIGQDLEAMLLARNNTIEGKGDIALINMARRVALAQGPIPSNQRYLTTLEKGRLLGGLVFWTIAALGGSQGISSSYPWLKGVFAPGSETMEELLKKAKDVSDSSDEYGRLREAAGELMQPGSGSSEGGSMSNSPSDPIPNEPSGNGSDPSAGPDNNNGMN